jgi:hypothetical protein
MENELMVALQHDEKSIRCNGDETRVSFSSVMKTQNPTDSTANC